MNLTMEERVARFEMMYREGRLLRHAWVETDTEGRERACWLAALSPEAGVSTDVASCPADVMPLWLAVLTPGLDDRVSGAAWPAMAERFGRCASRWQVLNEGAWARVERSVKLEALTLARASVTVDSWGVLPAIDGVMRLLREGGSLEAWHDANAARADANVARADANAARATADAARAARAAADATNTAAYAAAAYAADAAADAARAAYAADAAARVAYAASARAAAWDQIATALFDAIDREVLNARRA